MTASHLDFKSGPRTLLLFPLSPLLLSPQEKGKRRRRGAKVAADENCPTFLPIFKKAPGWFRVDAPRTSDASRVEIHDWWWWNFSPSIECTMRLWPIVGRRLGTFLVRMNSLIQFAMFSRTYRAIGLGVCRASGLRRSSSAIAPPRFGCSTMSARQPERNYQSHRS
jgi:hypothetical protein